MYSMLLLAFISKNTNTTALRADMCSGTTSSSRPSSQALYFCPCFQSISCSSSASSHSSSVLIIVNQHNFCNGCQCAQGTRLVKLRYNRSSLTTVQVHWVNHVKCRKLVCHSIPQTRNNLRLMCTNNVCADTPPTIVINPLIIRCSTLALRILCQHLFT
jgi:hypothetical protein